LVGWCSIFLMRDSDWLVGVRCSSGRLAPVGEYEPVGVALAYAATGGSTVVANLWDVTDRDIDRFSNTLLCRWLEKGPHVLGNGTRVGSGQEGDGTRSECMGVAVGAARNICRLPHLIGAAPVCYGLPTSVEFAA
jgi:separase